MVVKAMYLYKYRTLELELMVIKVHNTLGLQQTAALVNLN
jgi:hypothetical protein